MKTIMRKVKENKAIILKLLALILILAVISVATMLILFATDVLNYDGGFVFNSHILERFTGKWYGFIVLMLIQIVLSMLLCAIPGVAAAFVMISSEVLYAGNLGMAFFFSYSCVVVASAILYLIGRFGGYKICEKLLGKEDCEKSLELLRTRGTSYFPLMMLFPIFPDDALVMIAGTTRMRLGWFIPSILICRGIGTATIIFGMALVPFDTFTSVYHWLILITVCFFWIQELFKLANKVDRYFAKKRLAESKPGTYTEKKDPKRYTNVYLNTIAILISFGIAAIPKLVLYDRLIVATLCYFWIKMIFFNLSNLIYYFTSKRVIPNPTNYDPAKVESVNTCHTIATVIICIGIAVVHFSKFNSFMDMAILVTVSFFWLGQTFKLANKIDHYFAKKRLIEQEKLHGATQQTLEESMDLDDYKLITK